MGVHADLGGFVHDLNYADLPGDVVAQARRCLLDLIGVAAAGSTTRMSRITRDHAARHFRGDARTARLFFDGRVVSPVGAALANAATIDAIDGHESHRLTKGHAGAAVLPAALAFLDGNASATGRDLLTALVVGYEVATRAGIVLHATAADYHSSGAWNALGAAAAGARVLGLGRVETEHALGIAEYHAPRSPMMRCIDHPTMVKDSSAWGAHAGTSAALLAAEGFTGAPASVLTVDPTPWSHLGQRWTILAQYLKPYPVCRWAHPAVHGVLSLVRDGDVPPGAIRQIEVTTFDPATRLMTRLPATTEEAQYSLPFAVAVAAVHRTLPFNVIAEPSQAGEHVWRLASGMLVAESAEMTAAFSETRLASVTVVLEGGRRLSSAPLTAPGDVDQPLTDDTLEAKFLAFTAGVIGDGRARHLLQTLSPVDHCELADLLDMICSPACLVGDRLFSASSRWPSCSISPRPHQLLGSHHTRARSRPQRSSGVAQQVPPIAGDVEEHSDAPVGLGAWRGHELHPSGHHPLVGGVEVVHPKEEPDAVGDLIPDDSGLRAAIGTGEQDARLGTGRADNDPPLRSAVVG